MPDAPGVAFFVQILARKAKTEIEYDQEHKHEINKDSRLTVPRIAGVRIQTAYDFPNGKSWGTVNLIYGLERALGQALWVDDHLSPKWDATLRRRKRS